MLLKEIKGKFVDMKLSDLADIKVHLTGPEQVDHYRKLIRNGEKLLPIQLMKAPNGDLTLSDGNHRLQAYRDEGVEEIPVQILETEFVNGQLRIK